MRRWFWNFTLMSLGTVAALLAVVWAVGGFEDMGLSHDGLIALVILVAATVVLSLGLMALMFYSDRSGLDEKVRDGHDLWEDRRGLGRRHQRRGHRESEKR